MMGTPRVTASSIMTSKFIDSHDSAIDCVNVPNSAVFRPLD